MTPAELNSLGPWFRDGERYLNGTPIDWSTVNFRTMQWVKILREHLGEPIRLIRGAHPNQPSAVDLTCPTVPLGQVLCGLMRLPDCSWGVYSGNSFHVDTRDYQYLPARWCAIKPNQFYEAQARGLAEMFPREASGWRYCERLNSSTGFRCLQLVIDLAEGTA